MSKRIAAERESRARQAWVAKRNKPPREGTPEMPRGARGLQGQERM